MKNVAIVDYGMGNLDSVMRAVEECGGSPLVISREKDFEIANYIILPGVGAFAMGMQNIRKRRRRPSPALTGSALRRGRIA